MGATLWGRGPLFAAPSRPVRPPIPFLFLRFCVSPRAFVPVCFVPRRRSLTVAVRRERGSATGGGILRPRWGGGGFLNGFHGLRPPWRTSPVATGRHPCRSDSLTVSSIMRRRRIRRSLRESPASSAVSRSVHGNDAWPCPPRKGRPARMDRESENSNLKSKVLSVLCVPSFARRSGLPAFAADAAASAE